jgi:O-antigen/teichoic acid export membrane protein
VNDSLVFEMLSQEMSVESGVAVIRPPRRPLGHQIIRNIVFGGLRYILVVPIPFIMPPLILHKIGVSGYGTWAVFLAINGLTSLADLGLVGTLSKFVAEYHARSDYLALERLLNSGLGLFILLDVLLSVALWFVTPSLAKTLFRGSLLPNTELIFLLRCFLVVIAANILTQLFSSVTTGLQRLDLTNVVSAANLLVGAFLGAILLLKGWGLRGLVYGYMAAGILTIAAYLVIVKALLPQIPLNPLRLDRAEAKKMFSFSLRLYITQAAVAVHNQVEKVFLGILVGVDSVGWYDIASDIALKVRGSIGLILSPVLTAASELDALGDESRMRELYFRAHKYMALIGVPMVCYVVAVSNRFVELWIGPGMRTIALPLSVLLVVNFFNLATGPGFLIFAGRGHMRPGVQSAVLGIVLNVFLSLGLIYKFGFAGAVLGTSASLIVASAFFMSVFHRTTGYSVFRVLSEAYLRPILCAVPLLFVVFLVWPARNLSWFGLVGIGLLFAVVYGAAILLCGFFDDYDWLKIEPFVPGARLVRRIVRSA